MRAKSQITNHKSQICHIVGSVARTLLALTFIFSGFVKAVDPLGTVYKIEDYLKAFGGFFTDLLPIAGTVAVLLIVTEWLLGWTMLLNVRTKWTSWISLLFYLFMTPLTLWSALTNKVADCGCFGDALTLTNWQTFWKDVVLLALTIVLLCCRKKIPQLFSNWMEAVIAVLVLGSAAGIMGYSYTHLPPIDFRPYKVGNDINELTHDEVAPVIKVFYTFEKDGQLQEFLYADRPDINGDSTWTFIEQETRTLVPGKDPTIHDFEILRHYYDEEYDEYIWEELTDDILMSEDTTYLVTMYDLNKTDRKQMDKLLNLVYEHENVYFLTGSGDDDIAAFAEELGWEEEMTFSIFCFMDPVAIKTIVRANPGLVVLVNGKVIEKHNMRNL